MTHDQQAVERAIKAVELSCNTADCHTVNDAYLAACADIRAAIAALEATRTDDAKDRCPHCGGPTFMSPPGPCSIQCANGGTNDHPNR